MVNMLVMGDNLNMRIKGRALDDGVKGATIRVQLVLPSKKIMYGEVVNVTTVKKISYN